MLYAFIKLFMINSVKIKVLAKMKMSYSVAQGFVKHLTLFK